MKKSFVLVSTLAMVLGVGVAVGAHQGRTEKVEAAVTNGTYRLNVLTKSANWTQDNVSMWICFDGTGRRQMNRDTDFPVSTSTTSYSTVVLGSDTYNWITLEMDSTTRNGITYDNPEIGRGSTSDDWNNFYPGFPIKSNFKSNTWDNTFILGGTWDGFSSTNYGWYVKVALHTGLDLSSVSYKFMQSGATPENPSLISGYTFDGWYTDSTLETPWTSGSQFTDINLYAKYVPDTHNYSVTVGDTSYNLVPQDPGTYDAQYSVKVDATKGDLISFTVDDTTPLATTPDGTGSNNVFVPTQKVLETAENVDIWLKKSGSNWEYWLGGREAEFFLVNGNNTVALTKDSDPLKNEYYAENVSLAKDSTVKLYASVTTYDGKVEDGSVGVTNTDGFMTVSETGNYNVYYKPSEDNYVFFNQLHNYVVKINNASPETLVEVAAGEGYKKQFKATITVDAGDVLSFEKDSAALTVSEDGTNQHNVFVPDHKVIHGGTVDVYLKLDNSDNWSYYLAGRNATYYLYTDDTLTALLPNPENENEVYATNVNLVADETVKIYETSLTNPTLNTYSEKDVLEVKDGVLTVKTGGSYNFYYNHSESSLYVGNVSKADSAANAFAELFLATLSTGEDHVCQEDGSTDYNDLKTAWGTLVTAFNNIYTGEDAETVKPEAQNILKNASKEAETSVGHFAKLYDFILGRYGTKDLANFASRTVVPLNGALGFVSNNIFNGTSAIIVIISAVAVSSIGMFLILKKKETK